MPAAANHAGRTREARKFLTAPVTPKEKESVITKARRLKLPEAELIRRAVFAYDPSPHPCKRCGF